MIRFTIQAMKRSRREDGAVALMTLCFMMMAGLVCMTTLWSIGYASAAYNALYNATQAAAFAAAGQAVAPGEADDGDQLTFNCGAVVISATNAACTDGVTLRAAQATLAAAFAPGTPGRFGLTFNTGNTGIVQLTDSAGTPSNMITAYYVADPSAVAYSKARLQGSPSNWCGASGVSTDASGIPKRYCWAVREGSVIFPPKYVSGILVKTRARMAFPICTQLCGTIDINASGAASAAQPRSPSRYANP